MDTNPIETDYLVVGAGATAMAFVDTLLSEKLTRRSSWWIGTTGLAATEITPILFIGMHQPAAFYGVNSRELSSWTKDKTGLNQGMYELSSGAEVFSYFDQLMRQRFLPSGQVQWFPMSDYGLGPGGAHRFKSLVNGDSRQVIPRKKLVNATHARRRAFHARPPICHRSRR